MHQGPGLPAKSLSENLGKWVSQGAIFITNAVNLNPPIFGDAFSQTCRRCVGEETWFILLSPCTATTVSRWLHVACGEASLYLNSGLALIFVVGFLARDEGRFQYGVRIW